MASAPLPVDQPISEYSIPSIAESSFWTLSGSSVPSMYLEADSENSRFSMLEQELGILSKETSKPVSPAIAISQSAIANPPFEQSWRDVTTLRRISFETDSSIPLVYLEIYLRYSSSSHIPYCLKIF